MLSTADLGHKCQTMETMVLKLPTMNGMDYSQCIFVMVYHMHFFMLQTNFVKINVRYAA